MKVLVIGGTGYIGSHTVEELVRRDHDVWVFARGATPTRLPSVVSLIQGDRHNPDDLIRVRAHRFDAVIDINAYTREETLSVINTFDGAISRLVHLSTLAVNQRTSGMPLTEDDALVTDPSLGYSYDKAECERALRWAYAKSEFPFVSIRPPAVYGPRDRLSRENYFLKRIIAGDTIIIPDSGAVPIHAVYVKDLAAAMANALEAEGVTGQAYHIAQRELVSLTNHVANVAQIAGEEVDTEHVPSRLLERLGFNLLQFPYYSGDRLIVCDTRAAERDLGFAPTPYICALNETIEYFLARNPESQPSIEDRFPPVMPRSRERALVEKYRAMTKQLEDRLTDEWLGEAMPEL
ncbi:MAG TPA: NAD-dependent epimerase/dehydratase family protein [Blastocatellia bacterium]|nr:NAD-dependent epimerase/dehydratase family protein [Blastocatellia bacterium]